MFVCLFKQHIFDTVEEKCTMDRVNSSSKLKQINKREKKLVLNSRIGEALLTCLLQEEAEDRITVEQLFYLE